MDSFGRLLKRNRAVKYLFLLLFIPPILLGVVGLRFTLRKLDRMEQIRGWKPGATVRNEVVLQKASDPEKGVYWVAFTDENIRVPGHHRMNLPREQWEKLQLGEPLEVVYVPDDLSPHTRDGIYASDANFAFDRGLLMVEGAMVGVSVIGATFLGGFFLIRDSRSRRKGHSGPSRRRRAEPLSRPPDMRQ
jgi:hypothetical protein